MWVPGPKPKHHRPLGTLWVMEISVVILVFGFGHWAGVLDKTPFLPGGLTITVGHGSRYSSNIALPKAHMAGTIFAQSRDFVR